jgi:hypothetical protein
MGIAKTAVKGNGCQKQKQTALNNKKRAHATKIKGELRLPFVLSAI